MKNYDIIVIGGGILGLAHAYHCLKAGLKVALIERNRYPRDASVRNFGQIVPSGFGVKWQTYGRSSLRIYKELQSQMDISLRAEGSYYFASNDEELTLLEELSEINRKNGYKSQMLSFQECMDKSPTLRKDYVVGGLEFSQEAVIDPKVGIARVIQYLVDRYEMEYISGMPINEVATINDRVMVSSGLVKSSYYADKVFLCNGAEFEMLYPDLFKSSNIEIAKIQMMDTEVQNVNKLRGAILTGYTIRRYESFRECPSYNKIKSKENSDSYQNQFGVHILFKQCGDGSIVIGDSHEYQSVRDGVRMDFNTNNELNRFILTEAQKIMNLDTWRIRSTWNGYYAQCIGSEVFNTTVDNHIHIVTGIGGKGMTGSFGYAEENVASVIGQNIKVV